MDLDLTHPAVSDLRATARRRIPHFAFEYLDSGTGSELGVARNRQALDSILFMPAILKGPLEARLARKFMGSEHSLPVGIAPVGMSGMIWPGAERILARVARERGVPYCMSTVATALPEDIGPVAGENGWFQLYAPKSPDVRRDILRRIKDAGFQKLVLTVDVPGESRRERQRRAYVKMPPKLTPKMILSMMGSPAWSLGMALEGRPRMKLPESYLKPEEKSADAFQHAGRVLREWPGWDYVKALRDEWSGDFLVKGVADPKDAKRLMGMGIDGIWVSNHSGRQFEAGPPAIEALPGIRKAVGRAPVIYDSGVSGGLDVMRAIALGADIVFLGRAFHYAIAALGEKGVHHLLDILESDMRANMAQIGVESLDDLKGRVLPAGGMGA